MTTITINDPKIEKMFSQSELQILVMEFLQEKLEEEDFNLHEISIDDLTSEQLKAYNNRNNLNYVEY